MSFKQRVFYTLFTFAFLICKLNSDLILYANSTFFYANGSDCQPNSTNSKLCELSCIDQFRCANSRCISLSLVCNGENNCGDNSDETCDNITHIMSKTDEVIDKKPFKLFCHSDEFHCNSGECINKNFRCDSKNDCTDNSDELNCTTFKNVTTEKPTEIDLDCQIPSKQCLDINTKQPICLPIEKFCDHHPECLDSFDEGGHCAEDQCFNSNCTGTCHNTPQKPVCYCPVGSKLALDGYTCLKTEGLCEFGTCSQLCVPLKNRHKCSCIEGYTLDSDGFSCKSQDSTPAYIIYSNRHEIRSLDLQTTIMSRPLVSGLKNTIALDFFHSEDGDLIFFTDIVDDKIYKGSMIQGSLINIQVIVETGLSTAEALAVDWIGHNLYWVESMLDEIEVAKFDGSSRKTLIAGKMESPRSIVVDPRERLIWWTDWDLQQPRIESASMSGEDRVIIYNLTNKDGAWPNGLTLDLDNRRIYYVDARQDSVQTITYDGKDHREILSHNDLITHPFAISLFGSNLYITDWKTNSVVRTNKFNGSDTIPLSKAMSQPFDIKAYHPSRQPKLNMTHPCTINNGNCTHLCLLSRRHIYKCECPHIMKLSSDNRTCIPNEQVLLFARPNEIRGVDLENLQYHIISPISLPAVINTQQLDFDAKNKVIYYADTESNELKKSNLNNSVVEVIIDTLIENPFGLAFDWISNNLFVTSQETLKPKIYVCNSKGEYIHTVINRNLSKPYSIGVDPFNGNLFWTDHGSENPSGIEPVISPYIGMSKMDGSDFRVLVSSKNESSISKPSSLVLKFDKMILSKLYWINVGSGTIQSLDMQTNKIETIWSDQNNTDKQVLNPFALCLKGDKLIFSSQKYSSLYELDLNNKNEKLKELPLLRNQSEAITALKIYDKSLQYGTNLCEIKNGNCSHLCLPVSSTKRHCKCAIGFEADPKDETRCIGEKEFLLYSWNLGIKGVSLQQITSNNTVLNSKPVLPPISKVVMATNIDFISSESYIYLIDNDDGSIIRIKHDTTGYQTIVKNIDNLVDLCIDFVSKNLYWIESTYEVIEIARLNGTHRYVIVSTNISKPTSLTCDPLNGYLFWSNVNESDVQVFRSKLDGSEQRLILNETSAKSYINKLAIDLDEQQLYWCDSKSSTIERMNYDGLNRTIVYKNSNYLKNPVSISIDKKFVYYADTHFENGSILKIDKLNVTDQLRNASIIAEKMGDHIKDLTVYHEQPTTKLNPCTVNNGGCSELCLFMGNNKHRCICSHGRLSSSNNLTCEPYDAFIMYSKIVDIDSIHISDDNTQNSPYPLISNKTYMQNVIALTFSYKDKKIFYSDIQKGSINSMNFNGTDHQILVDKQGAVEGIAFDSLNNEIYFTSNSDASINRFKIFRVKQNKTSVEKIIKLSGNVDRVRGIALDSCRSMIYWTNWNLNKPSIQRSYLSGQVIQSIITTDIRMPNAITLDHKLQKLYWSDARLDKIERSNFDGSNRVIVLHEIPQHPFDLAIYDDYLFWTDWICQFGDRNGKGCVIRVNKFTGGELKIIKRKIPRPMGIIAIANDSEDCSLNPCLKMNGGCQERCGVEDNGTIVCSCFTGKQLAKDLKSCEIVKVVENITCASDEFKCKTGCIPIKLLCDGESECPDNEDEEAELCLKRECGKNQFKCTKTGVCINNSLVCDGEIDCIRDGSDEFPYQNCTNECKKHEFRCNNGECIPSSYYCDQDEDCLDGSDEYKCSQSPNKCQNDQFKCKSSNKCIQKSLVCNQFKDCDDGSDEEPKMCNFNKTENCSKTEFECANKKCISLNLLCNKKESCGDNSFDRFESQCGVNECNQKPNKCAHLCEDLPLGYRCSCHKGFVPIDDGKLCKDINECNQTIRVCSQHCMNKYGSYKCSCDEDYISLDNGTTCVLNSTIKPVILFANRFVIRQIDLDGTNLSPKIGHLTNAVALDFDYSDSCIYWSNITPLGSSIRRLCPAVNDTVQTIHTDTVQSPDGLAVDWINKNLYFCDKMKDTIEVSKGNGRYRKVLIKDGLLEPRAIVVDPYEGYFYYSDWGDNPYIGKAGMDGSNPRQIINASLGQQIGWPNALAIDYINKELFWGDAKLDFISVSDLEGGRRAVVVSKHNSRTINHIFAISVFENYIYFSDWETKSISKCEKYNCKNTTKLIDTYHRPMDLQVYHPLRQKPLNQTNPCDKLNCQTLCLLKPDLKTGKLSATCACPENFILNPDNRTCQANCTQSQFICKTSFKCIPKYHKCDSQVDCPDQEDEPPDCPPFYCVPGQFPCESGGLPNCLPPNQICDSIPQCSDGSDEKNCDFYTCASNQFKCAKHGNHSSFCIKKSKRCDCVADCPGKDDELDCPNSQNCLKENSNIKCGENDQDHSYCKLGYCKGNKYVCQKPFTCLDKEYCYNDGKCSTEKVKEKSYTYTVPKCKCKDGRYKGKRCEQCDKLTCKNGGYCTYPMNYTTPECRCLPGYLGNQCQSSLCDNYCMNDGQCRLISGIPECLCVKGFIGKSCSLSTCNGYCLNGGICLKDEGRQRCTCSNGFSGARCELNKCNCLNGGKCTTVNDTLTCNCVEGKFSGKNCQDEIVGSSKSESHSTGSSKRFYIMLGIVLICAVALVFIGIFTFRLHERRRHFMHRRMNETHGNLEIRNPIFDGELGEDSMISVGLNPAYNLDTEDEKGSSSFEHYNSYNSSPRTDESRNLLIDNESNLSRSSLEETKLNKFHPLA